MPVRWLSHFWDPLRVLPLSGATACSVFFAGDLTGFFGFFMMSLLLPSASWRIVGGVAKMRS